MKIKPVSEFQRRTGRRAGAGSRRGACRDCRKRMTEAAQEAAVRKAVPREVAAREAAVRGAAVREAATREAVAHEATVRKAVAREAVRKAAAHEAVAQEAAVRKAAPREVSAREAAVRGAAVREATAREAVAREATVRKATAREAVRKAAAHEAVAQEAAVRKAAPREVSAREAAVRGAVRPPSVSGAAPARGQRKAGQRKAGKAGARSGQVSAAVPDEIALSPMRSGLIWMRGKSDKGRRWQQKIEPDLAKLLVREKAAVVVNRHTIRRLFTNREFKQYILQRDHYTCRFCGGYGDTIDHLLPRAKGGHTTPVNCVCACNACNQTKADHDIDDFLLKMGR